jgi:hypothetical protein
LSDLGGISFNTSSNSVNILYSGNDGYRPVGNTVTNFGIGDNDIVSSTLTPATPVPWETDALPVVGSTILFGLGVWAKRKFAKPLEK